MSKYSSEPTYHVMKIMDKRLLGIDYIDATSLSLRQVVAASEVSWFALGYGPPSYETTFYNGDTLLSLPKNRKNGTDTENTILLTNIYLESLQETHDRAVYGVIDLLGDLGGVLEVIMVFTGIIFFPISEHHFILQATKRMFLARSSKRDDLFLDKKTANEEKNAEMLDILLETKMEENLPIELQEECRHHYLARLGLKDSILLFLYNRFYHPKLKKWCNWSKRSALQRLYNEGQERLEHELNIVNLLNGLRCSRILNEQLLISRKTDYTLSH